MGNSVLKYCLSLVAVVLVLSVHAQQKTDSLIINVGSSKVIILINDPKDLDEIANYDLNAILNDLKLRLSADSTLVDENEQVMNDTTIIAERASSENDQAWRDDHRDDDNDESNDAWRSKDDAKRVSRTSRHLLNFDLGTNNFLSNGEFPEASNAQHAVRPWGSWYFSINSVYQKQVADRFYIEIGPGISWYNFKFQDDRTRIIEVDDVTTFIEDPDPEQGYKKSKLTASFLNVSLVPMFHFGRQRKRRSIGDWNNWRNVRIGGSEGGFRLGVGGYAGYRLGSRSKVKFDGGKKEKDRDNFNLTSFRYGVRVQMGFKGTDLFFNYDVNELFNEGKGPDLNAFSFGIIL